MERLTLSSPYTIPPERERYGLRMYRTSSGMPRPIVTSPPSGKLILPHQYAIISILDTPHCCKQPGRGQPVKEVDMVIIPQKRCTKCGEVKPLDSFCIQRSHPTGYSSHCKSCHNAYTIKRPRQLKPRLVPGDLKACNRCNAVKAVELFDYAKDGDGYQNQCKVCRRAWARDWKRRNKDKIRTYEEINKERLSALRAEWRRKNHARVLERRRRWYKTPKARLYGRMRAHQRRVNKSSTVTPAQIKEMAQRQTRCYYCGKAFGIRRKYTIDHVIPLVKGGAHDISNIVLACWPCNRKKRDSIVRLL
jgi:hypothetical protein